MTSLAPAIAAGGSAGRASAVALAALLLFAATPSAVALSYGDCVQSEISVPGEVDTYIFYGESWEVVSVRMSDDDAYGAVYPRIRVYDPDDILIASNSAGNGVFSANINALSLSTAGTYRILADDRDGTGIGSYGLHLQCVSAPGQAVVLNYGDCDQSSIDTLACRATYAFTGSAGDVVSVRMSDANAYGDVYPLIRLHSPDGTLIVSDSAGNGQYSALIGAATLPASGTYTILAGDDDGCGTGSYGLHLQCVSSPGQATTLTYGDCDQNSIDSLACRATYTFDASAGDVVSIRMSDADAYGDVYPHIRLYGPDGSLIAHDSAGNGQFSALIGAATLPASGSYTILAGDDDGNGTGSYGLHLQCVSSPGQAVALTYGDCDQSSMDALACRETYAFIADAGDIVSARMWDDDAYGGVYPEIRIYDPAGAMIASDNAGNGTLGAEVEDLILLEPGAYTVLAGGRYGSDLGPFEFCLDGYPTVGVPEDPSALGDRVVVLGALPNPSSDKVSFRLSLPTSAEVDLTVHSPAGRSISRTEHVVAPGLQTIQLPSHSLPSGVYYYTMHVGDAVHRGQFTLVR